MNAEIISIGTELLLGQIVDTNSCYLSQKLAELGINVYFQTTVGDNKKRLSTILNLALSRSDIIITSGGLGPTEDDITIATISEVTRKKLILYPNIAKALKDFFLSRNLPFSENNLKQAFFPESAKIISNPIGTAAGMILKTKIEPSSSEKIIISLPGPPQELIPMFERTVYPYLKRKSLGEFIKSRILKTAGIGEAHLVEQIKDIINSQTNPTIAPVLNETEVHLRLTASGNDEDLINKALDETENKIIERIGEFVYGKDEETLEGVVSKFLKELKLTLSTAESCTGGLLAHRLTNISGSSKYFLYGIIVYSNEAKINLLKVKKETIEKYGAVSSECAEEMAKKVRELFKSDLGLSITGIAGPTGGTKDKPVGLVYIAIADQICTIWQRFHLPGDRLNIKKRAVQLALEMLRHYLISKKGDNYGNYSHSR